LPLSAAAKPQMWQLSLLLLLLLLLLPQVSGGFILSCCNM